MNCIDNKGVNNANITLNGFNEETDNFLQNNKSYSIINVEFDKQTQIVKYIILYLCIQLCVCAFV